MMPLTYAIIGQENTIKRVGGNPEMKQHLADMGFVAGATVTVVNSNNGNIIVNMKNTRVAINKDIANKIMI